MCLLSTPRIFTPSRGKPSSLPQPTQTLVRTGGTLSPKLPFLRLVLPTNMTLWRLIHRLAERTETTCDFSRISCGDPAKLRGFYCISLPQDHCFVGISRKSGSNPCKHGPNDLVFEAGNDIGFGFCPGMRFRLQFTKVKIRTGGEETSGVWRKPGEFGELHARFVASGRLTLGPVPGYLPELWRWDICC